MRGTGSTRTATRWSCSDAGRALLAVLALAVLGGCVTRTERFYVPTEGAPRLDQNAVRAESERFVRAECPRLLAGGSSATGAATLRLSVAADGAVREARVERPSSDAQLDGIFGALAAQLELPPLTATEGDWVARVRMGYSCAPGTAVATFEVL